MKGVTSKTAKYYDKIKRSFNFERSKSKEKIDNINLSFHPQINKKSMKLQRSGSVGEILYEDAINRVKKLENKRELSYVRQSQAYLNTKSEKFLIEKLHREIDELFAEHDIAERITFNQFRLLLHSLGYYKKARKSFLGTPNNLNQIYKKKASQSEDLLNEAFNLLCLSNSTVTPEDFKTFIFTLNNIVIGSMIKEGGN